MAFYKTVYVFIISYEYNQNTTLIAVLFNQTILFIPLLGRPAAPALHT